MRTRRRGWTTDCVTSSISLPRSLEATRPAGLDSDAAVDAAVAAALDALDAGGDEEVARRDVARCARACSV